MGLASALNTSLSSLQLNETAIDTLGNNIANAGTNGFKGSRFLFATQLSRTLSYGSAASDSDGGSNPRQVGLGAAAAAIQKDFSQGSLTTSTRASDLAIQGEGFFILNGPDGIVYTRNGGFSLNDQNYLVNDAGLRVQGIGLDDSGIMKDTTSTLEDMRINLRGESVAKQTTQVALTGSLFPTGDVSTQGSFLSSAQMLDNNSGTPVTATATSNLVDLEDASGNPLFTLDETVSFSPSKGGRTLTEKTFTVTATTTLGDLVQFMDETLGIHSGGDVPNDGNTGAQPGVVLNNGQIEITGNQGKVNEISIGLGALQSDGSTINLPFTKTATANGESTLTDFTIYDSLGSPINVRISLAKESETEDSVTFRYFMESADNANGVNDETALATGVLKFDSSGRLQTESVPSFTVDRTETPASSVMEVELDFSGMVGISSEAVGSTVRLDTQDGTAPGVLTSFVIDDSGVINGIYDNGIVQTLGKIMLAIFDNPQGLIEAGGTTYVAGVASGGAQNVEAGTSGAGSIQGGAIELSNTDIGRNLVELIVASTNYRGNARVISSVQELIDELLILGR